MMVPLKSLQFPIQYLDVCEALICPHEEDLKDFHRQCGVRYEERRNHGGMIDGEQFMRAYTLTQQYCMSDRPALFQILDAFPVTAHGKLGLLALASRTLEDALNAAIEFFPLVMPAFEVSRQNFGNQVHVNFERVTDFGEQNAFFTEMVMGALHSFLPFILTPLDGVYVKFAHVSVYPDALYEEFFHLYVQHEADKNSIVIPRALLETPLLTQNQTLQRQMVEELRIRFQRNHNKSVSLQVRRLLHLNLDEQRIINTESVAQSLKMSYRTLVRRLSQEGTTFRQLLDEVCIAYAKELLEHSQKPIAEIAQHLGFSSSANFARTFKRLTGKTPSEFRLPPQIPSNVKSMS
ncbi:hypothetical protein F895_00880 [Acinetobacter sp. CIP 64.2]|uniref:helix-turn-helix transcriptional regulator n=1 Tax=unclassified Acinetobacter TaxID=196816 RepID=UPI0002CFA35F|nr:MULTISPECIES: AraC family transcriptional regulator [unclassified Acinetobacter]ENX17736.1 hypothetical protein F895_00880 [Acinetobacter sp. CIP 64.2]